MTRSSPRRSPSTCPCRTGGRSCSSPWTTGATTGGADLTHVRRADRAAGLALARLGHRVLGLLGELGVPTFAFVNGLALGGGLELALNADYRTISEAVPALALPEVFLGLVPGWG